MIKEVDNFDIIAEKFFETPLNEDEYYLVQLLIRTKDGHKVNGGNTQRTVKYYVIQKKQDLYALKPEIIAISNALNARAYIYPQRRSLSATANEALLETTKAYIGKAHKQMRDSYLIAASQPFVTTTNKYITDVDDNSDINSDFVKKVISKVFEVRGTSSLANSSSDDPNHLHGANTDKIYLIVPSKTGLHIITEPFDREEFIKDFPDQELNNFIHTNTPTILYYSWEE